MQASVSIKISNKSTLHLLNASRRAARGQHSIFESLLFKISKIYQLSKTFNISSYILLQEIRDKIEAKTNYLFDEIERYEEILEKSNAYKRSSFTFKSNHEKVIEFHSPLTCDLVELITTYDLLISKLKLISMHGLFQTKNDFKILEQKYRKDLSKLILDLQNFKLNEISTIDLNNFAEQSVNELKAIIDHKKLERAIKSNITPLISDADYQEALNKVRQIEKLIA